MTNPKSSLHFLKTLKNNEVLDIKRIRTLFLPEWNTLSKDAQNYLLIPYILIGTRDIRPRFGKFVDPWNSAVPPKWSAPPPTFIKDSLKDIIDERAIEIISAAKKTNRNIVVLWSGGIDSTLILTALFKHMKEADHEMITVCLSIQSIVENPDFYFKFISLNKKIKVLSSAEFSWITDEYLNKNIILHGDPADGVFGPSVGMYQFFLKDNKHLEPWKKNLDLLSVLFEPNVEKDMFDKQGIGKWFSNIVTQTLEDSAYADNITTIGEWMWWTYFNFKWAGVCSFPLHNGITDLSHPGISKENYNFYADTVFFHTNKFQNWSYSNLKKLLGPEIINNHKLEARQYIYEFDKNFTYFSKKRKTSAPPPTFKNQKSGLIGHDQNFSPIFIGNHSTRDLLLILLQKYKINQ
jgi:hypothetical protein